MVRARARGRGLRAGVRADLGCAARRRRRQRHRRARAHPSSARHRRWRRGDYHAVVRGIHRAGDRDGGRTARLRGHRSREIDALTCRCGTRDHRADGRPHAGASVRAACRPPGARGARQAQRIGPHRRLLPGASRDLPESPGGYRRHRRRVQLLPYEEPRRARRRRRGDYARCVLSPIASSG